MIDAVVQCDDCSHIFPIQSNLHTGADDDGIEIIGFTCPKCKRNYIAYKTASNIKAMQEKVVKEREKAHKKVLAGVAPSRAYRKLRQAQRALEREMEKLNAERG